MDIGIFGAGLERPALKKYLEAVSSQSMRSAIVIAPDFVISVSSIASFFEQVVGEAEFPDDATVEVVEQRSGNPSETGHRTYVSSADMGVGAGLPELPDELPGKSTQAPRHLPPKAKTTKARKKTNPVTGSAAGSVSTTVPGPEPETFRKFCLRFVKYYFDEIKAHVCPKRQSSTTSTKTATAVVTTSLATYLTSQFHLDSGIAAAIAAGVIVVLFQCTKGAFCKMTKEQFEQSC